MQTKVFVFLIFASFCETVLADRPLERVETLIIFETLTRQPRKTWIPSGTICARHEEYRAPEITDTNEIGGRTNRELQAYLENPNKLELTKKLQQMKLEAIPFNVRYKLSNEYTMVSNVVVKFDGSSFYWEIDVDSRTDSLKPTAELAGNFFTEEFDLDWNQRRVFAWDGEKYITYFRPGNHAIVTNIPSGINGPLTAGIIPWGYGEYSYQNLSNAQSSANEVESNGQSEIHLTVINGDKEETFILDPVKDYAVKLYSSIVANASMTVRNYSNYQLVGGSWCPGDIVIEQYDITANPAKLMARDIWDFISISNGTPEPASFDVTYEPDAFIEDFSLGGEPLQYRYPNPELPPLSRVDTDELMMQRLMIASAGSKYAQNCATASLKYVCDRLGLNQSLKNLSHLINGRQKSTTLLEMQQFVHNLGLNSLAVKTDVEALNVLDDCQVILHLAGNDHYVVLGDIDEKCVRLIDLDRNNFYYRTTLDHFNSIWDGTALVLSNKPVAGGGNLAKIDNSILQRIVGTGEQCNTPCSNAGESPCTSVGALCGVHTISYARTCCGCAPSGTCSETSMIYEKTENCELDADLDCVGDGDWTSSSMSACS